MATPIKTPNRATTRVTERRERQKQLVIRGIFILKRTTLFLRKTVRQSCNMEYGMADLSEFRAPVMPLHLFPFRGKIQLPTLPSSVLTKVKSRRQQLASILSDSGLFSTRAGNT